MSPLAAYYQQVQQGLIREDHEQVRVLKVLEPTFEALIKEDKKRRSKLAFLRQPKALRGHYLYGGVGIGKTFLMDCFFNNLPFAEKTRLHFHPFMRLIHQRLKECQGQADPLQFIARELASQNRLLCFDELVVSDITDAMILGRLFKYLIANGLTLIFTSNLAPDDLYKNGLQRQHFLPAIALLKEHCQVTHLQTEEDYRLRQLKEAGVFYTPNDEQAQLQMAKTFSLLSAHQEISEAPIFICERLIPVKKRAETLIWFDFETLCSIPRSQQDYLALAELYQTVFISGLPLLGPEAKAKITLFIRLIDVFYDARVRLVLSAAAPVEKIYTDGLMLFDYQRAASRLLEMQSEYYYLHGLKPE